jgi:MFS family permease
MERLLRYFGTRPYPFRFLFTANFFFAIHLFLQLYINAAYLSTFIPERAIGSLYAISAGVSFFALYAAPRFLKHLGNYRLLVLLSILQCIVTLFFAFSPDAISASIFFITLISIGILLLYSLDIFIEAYTTKEDGTGGVRGMFLTVTNSALIFAPLLAGYILGDGEDYRAVYLLSAAAIVPFGVIMASRFQSFTDPVYKDFLIRPTLQTVLESRNLRTVFAVQYILRFFYAWMVVYLPIYLHTYVGLEWTDIGIVFTVMLLPFAILELPAGKLADMYLGEKEILVAGFLIIALSAASISFIEGTSLYLWGFTLFMTRVGAALVEIMSESYFFKHVSGNDTDVIAGFRMTNPLAFLTAPLVASALLLFVPISQLFVIVGAIMLIGFAVSLALVDTR